MGLAGVIFAIGVAAIILAFWLDRFWPVLIGCALILFGVWGFVVAIQTADFAVRYESFKESIESRQERATDLERAAIYREIADTNAQLASYQYWYPIQSWFADSRIPTLEPIK